MKLAALIEDTLEAGGGFNQALNALVQLTRLAPDRFELAIWTTREKNLELLRTLGLKARLLRVGPFDRLLAQMEVSQFGRRLSARLGLLTSLETSLVEDGVDLVCFTAPSASALALKHLNYIITVWDLCHRDTPEFPEVRAAAQFEAREWLYRNSLARALVVLTDSATLSARLQTRYGIDAERLLAMPFGPSPLLAAGPPDPVDEVLALHGLDPGFFFYPAQFWPHKNHVRLLQASARLRARGIDVHLVFAGGDKGGRAHVEHTCAELGLRDRVHFLGFVPVSHMPALYAACRAVVMPTYFGPTNLPPLEAWTHGKPLVYSRSFADQAGDAAILVDPDSAQELEQAMSGLLEGVNAADWAARGSARLQALDAERASAFDELGGRISRFALRRECWETGTR